MEKVNDSLHQNLFYRGTKLAIDTFLCLALYYFLLCCGYAFRNIFASSLLIKFLQIVVDIRYFFLIGELMSILSDKMKSRFLSLLLSVSIYAVMLLLLYLFICNVGYLEIQPTLMAPN